MKKIFTFIAVIASLYASAQDGTLDLSFGTNGRAFNDILEGGPGKIVVQPDNKIIQLVIGYTDHQTYSLIRLTSNGTPDNSFGTNGIVRTAVSEFQDNGMALALQPDGKILTGGQSWALIEEPFQTFANLTVIRYNPDGTLDNTFDGDGKVWINIPGFQATVYELTVQPDGKILAVGLLEASVGNVSHTFLMRFNADGSVDESFGTSGKTVLAIGTGNDMLTNIVLQPNGKIVLAGRAFAGSPAHLHFAIARFNNDGSPDLSFNSTGSLLINAAPTSSYANCVAVQPDGKIVVAGNSKYYGYSDEQFTTIRLNIDGTLDNSFNGTGMAFQPTTNQQNNLSSIQVQNDGKLLIGGYLTFFNIITHAYTSDFVVLRYTANGILDLSFKSDEELNQPAGGTVGGSGEVLLDCGFRIFGGYVAFQGSQILLAGMSTFKPPSSSFDQQRMVIARLNNTTGAVLPVKLTNFTATGINDHALLSWETATEQNAAYFNIERSFDGIGYETIGRVAAAGNSSTQRFYSFTDREPGIGFNHYRLKQVDADGKADYSPSRLVKFSASNAAPVRFYPVPSNGLLNMELSAILQKESKQVTVTNAAGAVVQRFAFPAHSARILPLDLGRLAKGVYFIRVMSASAVSMERISLQ